jgi:hypothetical protein
LRKLFVFNLNTPEICTIEVCQNNKYLYGIVGLASSSIAVISDEVMMKSGDEVMMKSGH